MKIVKLFSSLLMLILVLCILSDNGFAQRIVKIADGQDFVAVIKADSTGRKGTTSQTIYELARNGYFLASGTLTNTDFHLYIRAQDGAGPRPIIRPAVNTSTGASSRVFAPSADLTLRNIYLANLDNAATPLTISNGIRPAKRGVKITIDSCHIEFDVQSMIRQDADSMKVTLTNSIFSNIGNMNGNNGRILDTRGNMQDTIIIVNNIIYNNSEKILRTDNCRINYLRFEHNTMVNCVDGRVDLGALVKGSFSYNLLVNCGFAGRDKTSPYGSQVVLQLPKAGYSQTVEVKNNNYYVDPELIAAFPKDSTAAGFALAPYSKRYFMDTLLTKVTKLANSASGNDSLAVVFTKAPRLPKAEMLSYMNSTIVAPNKMEMDMGTGVKIEFEPHYVFDFTFAKTSALYARGAGGKPVGSLLDWKTLGSPLGVERQPSGAMPEKFSLSQNYPNPFNPVTRINYEISKAGMVSLKVYDMLGRVVADLVSEIQNPGSYQAALDADKLVSGVYFYTLQSGSFSQTRKMILMK